MARLLQDNRVRIDGFKVDPDRCATPHARRRMRERYELEFDNEAWVRMCWHAWHGDYPEIPGYECGPFRRGLLVSMGTGEPGAAIWRVPILWHDPRRGAPLGTIVTVLPRDWSIVPRSS